MVGERDRLGKLQPRKIVDLGVGAEETSIRSIHFNIVLIK